MMFRTFNFWYIVTPVTMVIAIVLALVSISESNTGAKKRVSDNFWRCGMICYCVIIWILLSKLFIAESLLGMIEALGSNDYDAADRARSTFWILAGVWAVCIFFGASFIRDCYIKYVNYVCTHGRSRADRRRRKRGEKKRREEAKELKKRRKLAESGKLYVVDFSNGGTSVRNIAKKTAQATPTSDQNVKQKEHTVKQQVEAAFKNYRIEKQTNLERVYTDQEGNKSCITDYLPEGVSEYFIAINLEREEEKPIFLGCENAEENLRRYLTMELEESDCSKHAAV